MARVWAAVGRVHSVRAGSTQVAGCEGYGGACEEDAVDGMRRCGAAKEVRGIALELQDVGCLPPRGLMYIRESLRRTFRGERAAVLRG
jgi:hypothetical protein